ncbi:MAG: DUF4115 domain-containing protein [Glaciimonas sp.]|nr:DUF4115 domain-containing protein [Glaciimonas sp.]
MAIVDYCIGYWSGLGSAFGGLLALRQPPVGGGVPPSATEASNQTLHIVSRPTLSEASINVSNATNANRVASSATNAVTNTNAKLLIPARTAFLEAQVNQLRLTFKRDAWVEIKRADKSTLFSRVGKAGSTETIDIDQPVSVVIGNLTGVEVTLRGVQFDLKTDARNNVARLNLK